MDKKFSYNEYDASRAYLWALLLPQAISFIVALVFATIYKTPEELESSLIYLFTACILSQACFAFIVFYYNKKYKINFVKASKIETKFSYRNLIGCMAIAVIAVFGFVNLINWLNGLFASIGFQISGASLPIDNFGWLIINVLLLALLPAVFEELVFRGMIFNGLRKRGFWFASIISSLMFSLVHLSMGQFIFPIIMGIIFSFILEKTGSLLYTIICHFCNNFVVLLISYINTIYGRDVTGITVNSPLTALLVIGIALLAGVLIFLIVKFVLKPSPKNVIVEQENLQENEKTNQIENSKPQNNNAINARNVQASLDLAEKHNKNMYIYGSLASGVALWLIMVLYGLFA